MDDEEPIPVLMVATCHTEGCVMEGHPEVAPMYPNGDPPVFNAQCGQCGKRITDLTPYVE